MCGRVESFQPLIPKPQRRDPLHFVQSISSSKAYFCFSLEPWESCQDVLGGPTASGTHRFRNPPASLTLCLGISQFCGELFKSKAWCILISEMFDLFVSSFRSFGVEAQRTLVNNDLQVQKVEKFTSNTLTVSCSCLTSITLRLKLIKQTKPKPFQKFLL